MKELSIEEKAHRYDVAIERAKNTIEVNQTIPDIVECVNLLFPELEELDDEEIRKEMIEILRKEAHEFPSSVIASKANSWIAYLEKQGNKDEEILILKDQIESLHAAIKAIRETHRIELEKLGKNNMGISEATKQKLEDNLNKALEKETPESCNEFLEKQDEKKEEEIEKWLGCEAFPEGTNITPLPKAMEIVRKTANHFYDFGRKQQAIRNIQCTNSQVITPESYINEGQKKGIQIVLDNPQEYGLQKIAKWSEEDKKMSRFIGNAITADGASEYLGSKGIQVIDAHTWLDELKYRVQPSNTWKPSNEQIGALWDSIKHNLHLHPVLKSLYNDLKKLREE